MANKSKIYRYLNISLLLLFIFAYPFGILFRINIDLFGFPLRINIIDLIALLTIPCSIYYLVKYSNTALVALFTPVIIYLSFILFISLGQFNLIQVIYGSTYLFKFIGYISFFVYIFYLKERRIVSDLWLLKSLLFMAVIIAIFGWFQYIYFYDLRDLKFIGWDDHYYRLQSTLIDPGYTGIVMLLGIIVSAHLWLKNNKLLYILYCLFLFISLLFTYSRASILALLASILFYPIIQKKFKTKIIIILISLILSAILILPRKSSEGSKLERTFSIFAKFRNYNQTLVIFKNNPLFGVGYNNLCSARIINNFGDIYPSHSCSGSDNGILFILATSGIIGLFIFLRLTLVILEIIKYSGHYTLILLSLLAVFVHGMFLNNFFYSWILGWLAILILTGFNGERLKNIIGRKLPTRD